MPGGDVIIGSDQLAFPTNVPTVNGVQGCTPSSDGTNSTINCPTAGGARLTIFGSLFGTSVTAFVNGASCGSLIRISDEVLTCSLPSGAGLSQSVTVSSTSQFSAPAALLSYAKPDIQSVQGCTRVSNIEIKECNREGNDLLTITGSNFGGSQATVLIGTDTCTQLLHDINNPNGQVTCQTPAGSRLDRPVLLIQRKGEISGSNLLGNALVGHQTTANNHFLLPSHNCNPKSSFSL
jgi:hypothetical protein